ncbi:MAG: hypothetical protein QG608_3175 [Actinomycetota bacterium]|nr:hypothetical protein [Actinomycetota bacterium]
MTESDTLELGDVGEPLRLHRKVTDGTCLITYGNMACFRYDAKDTGMCNLALVAVTDAGVPVKDAATVFALTPEYVSELRGRACKEGSGGLVKPLGRPSRLTPAQITQITQVRQVRQVRQELGLGAGQSQLARKYHAFSEVPVRGPTLVGSSASVQLLVLYW